MLPPRCNDVLPNGYSHFSIQFTVTIAMHKPGSTWSVFLTRASAVFYPSKNAEGARFERVVAQAQETDSPGAVLWQMFVNC